MRHIARFGSGILIAPLSLAAALMAVVATAAEAKQAKCSLVVDGKTYIDKRCEFTAEKDGSFKILDLDSTGNVKFFASVEVSSKGVADAFWNEEEGANHAHTSLGTVKRAVACWTNERTSICAR